MASSGMDVVARVADVLRPVMGAVYAYLDGRGDLRAIEAATARAHSLMDDPPSLVNVVMGLAAEVRMGVLTPAEARAEMAAAVGLSLWPVLTGGGDVAHIQLQGIRHHDAPQTRSSSLTVPARLALTA